MERAQWTRTGGPEGPAAVEEGLALMRSISALVEQVLAPPAVQPVLVPVVIESILARRSA